jgi:hypothetical protein
VKQYVVVKFFVFDFFTPRGIHYRIKIKCCHLWWVKNINSYLLGRKSYMSSSLKVPKEYMYCNIFSCWTTGRQTLSVTGFFGYRSMPTTCCFSFEDNLDILWAWSCVADIDELYFAGLLFVVVYCTYSGLLYCSQHQANASVSSYPLPQCPSAPHTVWLH